MKNSLVHLRAKNLLILFIIFILGISCSKTPGKTSSKIKIFSGNFATILSSTANNGLIFYGRSVDGKYSFTKKIDTDTIDLVFPNGTWNFYAVSWELGTAPAAGALPDFNGKTYCGKASAVLNGTDASVSLNLSNAGCADPEFSADTKLVSVNYTLPSVKPFTCKDISGITGINNTACDQNAAAKFNKGYATSYRVVAFEYTNFGVATAPVKIAQSACVRADYSTLTGMLETADSSLLNSLHVPTTPGRGLSVSLEVFYSAGVGNAGCDATLGVDIVPLGDSPRTKVISDAAIPTTYNVFVKSDAPEVCSGPRLASTSYAAGFGTAGSPYAICTPAQLDLLRSQFTTYKESSFDLLTDVSYAMAHITPIGDPLISTGTGPVSYYGKSTVATNPVFDGRNHSISNFMIDCVLSGAGNTPNNGVGFFRYIKDATIKNLTFNNAIVMCDGGNQVGVLSGMVSDTAGTTTIENIRVHGHADGSVKVGGVVGDVSGQAIIAKGLHVKGDFGGSQYVGGLFGNISTNGPATSTISQVTFAGSIHGNDHNGNGMPSFSYAGGLIGYASTAAGSINIDQAVVKAKRVEGSTTIGGFIGESLNTTISNSYVEAVLRAWSYTVGPSQATNLGGAIGKASGGSLNNVIVANGVKSSGRDALTDHTYGGLVGSGTATCTSSFYTGDHDGLACGAAMTVADSKTKLWYGTAFSITMMAGAWDAAVNPTPSFVCSPSDAGNYYEATSAHASTTFGSVLPGDILLCNGSAFSLVTLLNKNTTLATYLWSMPDDGFDIPRLSFEAGIENFVPYLKRPCHGHYTTQMGSGAATDPKWICTYNQFTGMGADQNSYYILKKNIIFDLSENGGAPHSPLPPGAYKLYGNNHGLYGLAMSLPSTHAVNYNYGIFSYLSIGSFIRNLDIAGATLGSTAATSGAAIAINAGILAGVNLGTISNVNIDMSKATLDYAPAYADNINFGGVVGLNGSGALIEKSELNVDTKIINGNFSFANSFISGSVAASNSGTISGVRSHGSLNRQKSCAAGETFIFDPKETIGFFVGNNAGVVKEVDSEGEFRGDIVPGSVSGTCSYSLSGNISPFVATNTGTVLDFRVRPKIYMINTPQIPLLELFSSSTGTVGRGIVEIDSMNAFALMQGLAFVDTLVSWDAGTSPTAYNSTTPACDLTTIGHYLTVSVAGASTPFGNVGMNDLIVCNGSTNVLVPANLVSKAMAAGPAMTDVLFTVDNMNGGSCSNMSFTTQATCIANAGTWTPSPSLPSGRFYNSALSYSLGAGLVVTPNPPGFSGAGWSVTGDFLYPGANVWVLDLMNGASSTTKSPKLVKTEGGLEQLGPSF